jgi:phospholipid-transporting ATPase
MIPDISNSNGVPAQLFPLAVVIFISMMKDLFEDYKRHKSDDLENSKITLVYNRETKSFEQKQWRDLRVGMIVKV